MRLLVITHVLHKVHDNKIYGYGPYIKEMNLWLKHVEEAKILGPLDNTMEVSKIDLAYKHEKISFNKVPLFSLVSIKEILLTLLKLPILLFKIIQAMFWADHIHLRCPGNMGLLGSIVQVFFPWKIKTAKYAGNWDPNSKQPWSYNLQKFILSSTFLSKNMTVLTYGQWKNQSENILPFFTASYKSSEIIECKPRQFNGVTKLVFVGSLNHGKRPLLALESIKVMKDMNLNIHLDVMGDGTDREQLESYIRENNLQNQVTLHGNQNAQFVKEHYQQAHFLILMSKSEGWPKVVAEAMFWGCVPISTNVSCVNYMMGEGTRGKIALVDATDIATKVSEYTLNEKLYKETSIAGMQWSRHYTLESFDEAIAKVLS